MLTLMRYVNREVSQNQTFKFITLVFVGRSDSWQVCFLYRYLSLISFSDKRAMFFLGNLRFFSRVFRLSGSSFDLFLFDFLPKKPESELLEADESLSRFFFLARSSSLLFSLSAKFITLKYLTLFNFQAKLFYVE